MKMNYKKKKTLKQILSVVVAGLAAFGAIFGMVKFSEGLKEETKVIHPSFEVGGITVEGKGDKDLDDSIYTKKSFECKGLEIKLDFDAAVEYQVFYYDEYDKFLSSTVEYTESRKMAVPYAATNARVVVSPIWDTSDKEENHACHWYDVYKYSSQLEIRVLKDQSSSVSGKQIFNINDVNLYSSDMTNYAPSVAPFMYCNNENILGRKIVKIGVPVYRLDDCAVDSTFTIYVVKDDNGIHNC